MSGGEQKYIQDAFDTNWIAPLGPNINDFEKGLESYIAENKHIAVLNSGTGAIHLALLLLGVQKGDEVLCQSFTFVASVNPITYVGATPIFIDSEQNTYNLCPVLLEAAIKDRMAKGKKPKAIIAVHLYGMPYNTDAIQRISKKYEIPIIEDAASAIGSEVNGQKCGTFGDFGIFSFNGNKIITTSGGGALICNCNEEKENAIFLATQARDEASHYEHSHIGYNFRMSNVLAGIGRGQLEVLQDRVLARRSIFETYKEALKNTSLQFLEEPAGYYSNRWLTTVVTVSYAEREKMRLALQEQNIESRPLWKPMHLQPIFQKYPRYINGISENLFEKGLCLPSGSNSSEHDLSRVIEVLNNF